MKIQWKFNKNFHYILYIIYFYIYIEIFSFLDCYLIKIKAKVSIIYNDWETFFNLCVHSYVRFVSVCIWLSWIFQSNLQNEFYVSKSNGRRMHNCETDIWYSNFTKFLYDFYINKIFSKRYSFFYFNYWNLKSYILQIS